MFRFSVMRQRTDEIEAETYPLRAAARLTGLSPDVLRAWERRYGVVHPLRTPGGTRRYRASDLERLRLVKAAVDAGHRIGEVAGLDASELERRGAPVQPRGARGLEEALAAVERLDAVEAERVISLQLAALGPAGFAREFAIPLLEVIGQRWAEGRLCIASEHLASGVIRSLLGACLRPSSASVFGPRVVFGTPVGERHELGLLMAAIAALGAGANSIYLGTELPPAEVCDAVTRTDASAVGLGVVTIGKSDAERMVREVRGALPSRVAVWIGGALAPGLAVPSGVLSIRTLEELERHVTLLSMRETTRS